MNQLIQIDESCGTNLQGTPNGKQAIEIACETLLDLENFWNPSWWDTWIFPKQLHSIAKGFKECNQKFQKTEKVWKVTKTNQRNSLVYWLVPSENRSSDPVQHQGAPSEFFNPKISPTFWHFLVHDFPSPGWDMDLLEGHQWSFIEVLSFHRPQPIW